MPALQELEGYWGYAPFDLVVDEGIAHELEYEVADRRAHEQIGEDPGRDLVHLVEAHAESHRVRTLHEDAIYRLLRQVPNAGGAFGDSPLRQHECQETPASLSHEQH